MKVYELNTTYFLVDAQKSPQLIITFSANQLVPHICPVGTALLSEEFLAKATLRIDESIFLGCLLFQGTCVYYFYGAEVQTLSFRLPRQIERAIPKQLFKETEVLAFFKALRAQNCLTTHVHPSAFPTLPELTFYAMFCNADAETLKKVGIVTRFSIGHRYEHIYMSRDWLSDQNEKRASTLYYISCNLSSDQSFHSSASNSAQFPLIITNYNENLIDQWDQSVDQFIKQLSTILVGRSQRIRRLYFAAKEHCEALGPALSRHGLTPVLNKDHAELRVEFSVHHLMLSLTTDYQLILDVLLEQISAFGNSKEKRLNRVLTASTVDDLAERLLLQLDTDNLEALYLSRDAKPPSTKRSSYQHKVLIYAHKLLSALSTVVRPVLFAPFDETPFGLKGKSIYFQSDIPVSSANQIIAQCFHLGLGISARKSSEVPDQAFPHTISSMQVFVGSKRYPDTWYRLCSSHQVGLHVPTPEINMRRSSIIQESTQDGIPQECLLFSIACGISWGDSSLLGGIKTPFDFDLVRVDQQEDSQLTISYLIVPGAGADTGLSLCGAPPTDKAALATTGHVMAVRSATDTIIASLVADPSRSRSGSQVYMSNCYAVARYMSGEAAVPTTTTALAALMLTQEQHAAVTSPLLPVSIYQRAQQLVEATRSRKKGASSKSTYIKIMTDPRCNFAFTHGLLSILKTQKHEQKPCISLLMVVPNPMILEIVRLLVLYIPALLESSDELKVILGITGYDKLYKSSSYFTDAYIKLAGSIYKIASSTFLGGLVRSNNTLFGILSPQVRVRDNLYTHLRSAIGTNTLSLGEVADKFEQVLLDFLHDEPTATANSLVGLSCSSCGKSITEGLAGGRCAKCQLPFCASCSSLHDQIFYSSYDFTNLAPLCPECTSEESLLEPIYKILSSDKAMTESERARALLAIFDQDLADKLKASEDAESALAPLSEKETTRVAILGSFCEHLGHKLAAPVAMRLAGADGQLHIQSGCVCTHLSQSESSIGTPSLSGYYQETKLLVKPTSLLKIVYLAIPSSLFSEMEKEPSITSEPEGAYHCTEISTPLAGVRVFQYALAASSVPLKHSFQLNIPTTDYYILGFAAPPTTTQEQPPAKVSSTTSLLHPLSSSQYGNFGPKTGPNLLECDVKLTSTMLGHQKLAKCADSTIFRSIFYPHRTIVKLSTAKPDIIVSIKFPTVRAQRSMSPHLVVYYVACLSDSPLDREKRKAREGLVRQASDGIVTAAQVFSLPLLDIVNRQEITYQLPLSLRSAKSTMRLLFASAEEHTIVEVHEAS